MDEDSTLLRLRSKPDPQFCGNAVFLQSHKRIDDMEDTAAAGPGVDLSSQIASLEAFAAENRAFQIAVTENTIQMNGDNKLGQKSADVGK